MNRGLKKNKCCFVDFLFLINLRYNIIITKTCQDYSVCARVRSVVIFYYQKVITTQCSTKVAFDLLTKLTVSFCNIPNSFKSAVNPSVSGSSVTKDLLNKPRVCINLVKVIRFDTLSN